MTPIWSPRPLAQAGNTGLTLRFATPVTGPILLGRDAHRGGGCWGWGEGWFGLGVQPGCRTQSVRHGASAWQRYGKRPFWRGVFWSEPGGHPGIPFTAKRLLSLLPGVWGGRSHLSGHLLYKAGSAVCRTGKACGRLDTGQVGAAVGCSPPDTRFAGFLRAAQYPPKTRDPLASH